MLYDAHNHLQDEWLQPYYPTLFQEMVEAGIRGAVVNGTTEEDWPRVAALAAEHDWILPCFGLHPWYLNERTAQWQDRLLAALKAIEGRPIGIGEIGLDRWLRNAPDFEIQKEVFRWQLRVAAERNLPASLHCLRAWGAILEILEETPLPARGFLLHAYGGPSEMVPRFVELGAYFSFSGSFLAEGRERKLEPFRRIPRDRLLIETDAPAMPLPGSLNHYPLPPTKEGTPVNHPANLTVAFEGLAQLLGTPDVLREDLRRQLEANFKRLFLS